MIPLERKKQKLELPQARRTSALVCCSADSFTHTHTQTMEQSPFFFHGTIITCYVRSMLNTGGGMNVILNREGYGLLWLFGGHAMRAGSSNITSTEYLLSLGYPSEPSWDPTAQSVELRCFYFLLHISCLLFSRRRTPDPNT